MVYFSITRLTFCLGFHLISSALDLSQRNLDDVPSDLPSNDTTLDLSRNKLTVIQTDAFAKMQNLTKLWLDYNQISTIEAGAFSGIPNLEMLSLSRNKLERIPDLSLLPMLIEIHILKNPLGLIGTGYFHMLGNLTYLRRLYIGWAPINFFPYFSFLPNMDMLNIRGNKLRKLSPLLFKDITNLDSLRIGYNELSSFPEPRYLSKQMRSLDVEHNRIYHIPDMSNYPNLTQLDVSYNYISAVPETSVIHMTGGKLVLEGNPIPCVSELCWLVTSGTDVTVEFTCPDGRSWRVLDREIICEGWYSSDLRTWYKPVPEWYV